MLSSPKKPISEEGRAMPGGAGTGVGGGEGESWGSEASPAMSCLSSTPPTPTPLPPTFLFPVATLHRSDGRRLGSTRRAVELAEVTRCEMNPRIRNLISQ